MRPRQFEERVISEPMTPARALRLLADLGASPWLVRHHELVLEAAVAVCDQARRHFGLAFDRERVLVGAAVADAIAREVKREAWEVFDVLDAICEAIASDGPQRLARSVV